MSSMTLMDDIDLDLSLYSKGVAVLNTYECNISSCYLQYLKSYGQC